jgi:hypothetical protein
MTKERTLIWKEEVEVFTGTTFQLLSGRSKKQRTKPRSQQPLYVLRTEGGHSLTQNTVTANLTFLTLICGFRISSVGTAHTTPTLRDTVSPGQYSTHCPPPPTQRDTLGQGPDSAQYFHTSRCIECILLPHHERNCARDPTAHTISSLQYTSVGPVECTLSYTAEHTWSGVITVHYPHSTSHVVSGALSLHNSFTVRNILGLGSV